MVHTKKKNKKISLQRALIKILVDNYGFRKSDARVVYRALIETLVEGMLRGFDIELRGFGKIYQTLRKPMRVNTYFTNWKDVLVPMKKLIRFKPSPSLKEAINGIRSIARK